MSRETIIINWCILQKVPITIGQQIDTLARHRSVAFVLGEIRRTGRALRECR